MKDMRTANCASNTCLVFTAAQLTYDMKHEHPLRCSIEYYGVLRKPDSYFSQNRWLYLIARLAPIVSFFFFFIIILGGGETVDLLLRPLLAYYTNTR
jgi:hypothetical protein